MVENNVVSKTKYVERATPTHDTLDGWIDWLSTLKKEFSQYAIYGPVELELIIYADEVEFAVLYYAPLTEAEKMERANTERWLKENRRKQYEKLKEEFESDEA